MKNQTKLSAIILSLILLSLLQPALKAQAVLGLSVGGGIGTIHQNFTENTIKTPVSFVAPGPYLAAELSWDRIYFDMSLAIMLAPDRVRLGDQKADLSGYPTKIGIDFNAFGIGYLHPVDEKFSAGAALGFHVSALTFTPEDETDLSLLRFGGYYGLIGLDLVPRLRYNVNDRLNLSVSLPLGLDFGPMSEDVVVGGVIVGESPAIVQPESLVPDFTGFTLGLYLSAGYTFQLNR